MESPGPARNTQGREYLTVRLPDFIIIGAMRTMTERPQLSDRSLAPLCEVVDEGLMWIGSPLSGASFKTATAAERLEWRVHSQVSLG